MKVYTDIIYIWKDDKLVQTDSQSFDYEGEVTQCHEKYHKILGRKINSPHSHGTGSQEVSDMADAATTNMANVGLDKPGGDVKKQITDPVRNWSKKLEHHVWGNEYPGRGPGGDDSDNQNQLAALNRSRKTRLGPGREGEDKDSDERRGLTNMSMGTLLTQGQKAKKLPTA